MNNEYNIAVFPGSFDPFTYGHKDIVEKGLKKFSHIIVVVAETPNKDYLFKPDERVEMAKASLEDFADKVSVDNLGNKLLVDFVREIGSKYIIRGYRDELDKAYEERRKLTNQVLDPSIDTELYGAPEKYKFLRASDIREIIECSGGLERIKDFVHPFVYEKLKKTIRKKIKKKKKYYLEYICLH